MAVMSLLRAPPAATVAPAICLPHVAIFSIPKGGRPWKSELPHSRLLILVWISADSLAQCCPQRETRPQIRARKQSVVCRPA